MLIIGVVAAIASLPAVGYAGTEPASTGPSTEPGGPDGPGGEVWYLDVTDANPLVEAIAQGLYDRLLSHGYTMKRTFALNTTSGQLDLTMQSQGFDRALPADPAAIAYFLLDPTALGPQVAQAAEQGIPVFAAFGQPSGFDVNGFISMDDEEQGYISASYLAANLEEGDQVAVITGPPTPNVEAEVAGAIRALEEAGVEIVGDVDDQRNLTDNLAGGQEIMQGIIQRYPDIDGVFAYNDDSALGAIAAARAAGIDVLVTSRNGSADAVEAIRAGDLLATCDIEPVEIGAALGDAIAAQIEGTEEYTDSRPIDPPDPAECLITADNVDEWVPWNEQIEIREIPQG